MDSDKNGNENVVSGPLKHLLSLDWESTRIVSKSKDPENDIEQSKPKKKVRFSDEVKEILCYDNASHENISILEKDENNHTYSSQSSENLSDPTVIPTQNECNTEIDSEGETSLIYDKETNCFKNKSVISSAPVNLNDGNTIMGISDSDISIIEDENSREYGNRQPVSCVLESDIKDLTTELNMFSLHVSQHSNLPENQICKKVPSVSSNKYLTHQSQIHQSFMEDDASRSLILKGNPLSCEEKFSEGINQKLYTQKQSQEINSIITRNESISSASELKTTVFKAWCRVKDKNKVIETSRNSKPDIETPISRKTKKQSVAISKHAYTVWKKAKNKAVLSELKDQPKSEISSSGFRENNKSDAEEREMAFKSWKKRKDEILKSRRVSERKKEEQHKAILLMNADQKKKEAEAAFFEWEAQKSRSMEIENKKKAWLQHVEEEQHVKKDLRDKDALEMYYLWLETKNIPCERNSFDPIQTKPPWVPPGKPPV